jgi:GR25 family glycosyltransferase involved in LPS biosynthesis
MGHISLCIKHIKCMEDLVSSDYDNAVFLEDDVVFHGTKADIINSLNTVEEVPYDVLFFGGGFDHRLVSNRVCASYKNLLLVDHPATNCTSSYALTKSAAEKVLGTFTTICTSIDWELNYHFKENKLKVWHTDPYLCGQLSTAGVYECTL